MGSHAAMHTTAQASSPPTLTHLGPTRPTMSVFFHGYSMYEHMHNAFKNTSRFDRKRMDHATIFLFISPLQRPLFSRNTACSSFGRLFSRPYLFGTKKLVLISTRTHAGQGGGGSVHARPSGRHRIRGGGGVSANNHGADPLPRTRQISTSE
jgi:hypothetical protein